MSIKIKVKNNRSYMKDSLEQEQLQYPHTLQNILHNLNQFKQRATLVIAGWFAGPTWTNNNKLCT